MGKMMPRLLPGANIWQVQDGAACSMTAVTLGTGVGGGIILNGRILEGDNGAAGELGHMVIHQNGHPCTCGRKGCLEAYASATALVSRAREAMERSDESMLWSLCKGDLSGVNGRMIFEASEKGDSTACEVLDGFMEDLSEGIANIINILQPEILCIGGGLSGAGEALLSSGEGENSTQNLFQSFPKEHPDSPCRDGERSRHHRSSLLK